MKLLLVLSSDETLEIITRYVKPLGFEIIRYSNVLKAMDNVDEADPSGIIISARDFPRHWKTMVQFVRAERPKSACPIVILKGENFTVEESSQASFLGVSAIVTENLENPQEIGRIQEILCRYLPTDEKRRSRRYIVQPWQRVKMVFALPADLVLVTGELKTISTGGVSLLPDHSKVLVKTMINEVFNDCSLRVGDSILNPKCRLVRSGRIISMEFLSFPENEVQVLNDYLINSPLKELIYKQSKIAAQN
ncbi:MAG: PilZ domain-containing protein [Treponema sp.]|nr:PilZ domain-containing protein [Treponema sp.]